MDTGDNQEEPKETRRTSGATRRIVVEDSREKIPRAKGRRLDTPDPPPSNPPPRLKRAPKAPVNFTRIIMIAGGMITILVVVPAIAVVLHSARNKKLNTQTTSTVPAAASQTPVTAQLVTPQASPSERPSPDIENAGSLIVVEPAQVRSMVLQLASQISQKSGYEFGPEFIELIRGRTQEYVDEKALIGARQFRREINKSFRDEGLNPLVGYVLGMSRSKFDPISVEKGVGIWQLPVSVARSQGYIGATDNAAKLKIPETSAQIAASYTKQLLSAFDAEDFMYAIACFGMSLQEAGQLQARLVHVAPDTKSRRDIMKVIRSGVLTEEQVDNIARFFAAGIVGENPQEFGLTDSQPLSSLY